LTSETLLLNIAYSGEPGKLREIPEIEFGACNVRLSIPAGRFYMEFQKGLRREHIVVFIMAGLAMFPQPAYAVEAGCFCTFIFVSIMFIIGIAATLIIKYLLSRKIWQLSLARTSVITFIEVVLMMVVLIVLQT